MSDEVSTEMVNVKEGSTAVAQSSDWFEPNSLQQAVWLAKHLSGSPLLPKTFSTPASILIGFQYAKQLGLPFLQIVQGLAVINGRPSLYGDTMLALCQKHHAWGGMHETLEGEGDTRVATCTIKRDGDGTPFTQRFSMADAKRAGLLKPGPWQQYPQRMLQMRARSWALRDAFADALAGLSNAEEMESVVYQSEGLKLLKPKTTAKNRSGKNAATTEAAVVEAEVVEAAVVEAAVSEPKKDSGMPQREFVNLCAALSKFKGNSKGATKYWERFGPEARRAIGQCASQLKRVNELLAGAGVAYEPAGQTSNAPTPYDAVMAELEAIPSMELADAWEKSKAGYQNNLSEEEFKKLEAQVEEWFTG